MTTRKVILYSLILPAGLSVWMLWFSPGSKQDQSERAIIVCLIFCPWVVGLLLGLFLSAIFRRPKAEPYFYLSGQLAIVLTIVIYIISDLFQGYLHEKKFGNIDSNHSMVGVRSDRTIDSVNYSNDLRTAFFKLESTFTNPNSFLIIEQTSRHVDIPADKKARLFYFIYLVDKKKLFSSILVVDGKAFIQLLNADMSRADEYQRQSHQQLVKAQQFLDSIEKMLPDSVK